MKLMPVKAAQWLLMTVLMAVVAYAAGQNAQLPEGEGKTILNSSCSGCHALDVVQTKQATKDEWKAVVMRMQGYGTAIDEKQSATLVDYLAANFGPKDDSGKKVLEAACGSCHGLDLVTGRTGTKAEWQDIVDRMIGRGATIAESDIAPLVDYLTKTYGPK